MKHINSDSMFGMQTITETKPNQQTKLQLKAVALFECVQGFGMYELL